MPLEPLYERRITPAEMQMLKRARMVAATAGDADMVRAIEQYVFVNVSQDQAVMQDLLQATGNDAAPGCDAFYIAPREGATEDDSVVLHAKLTDIVRSTPGLRWWASGQRIMSYVVTTETPEASTVIQHFLTGHDGPHLGLAGDGNTGTSNAPSSLETELEEARKAFHKAEDRLARAYRERTIAAVLAAKMALQAGYDAGVGLDGNEDWDLEWRQVLYVDLPDGGQISWHVAPADQDLLAGLPAYGKAWNGTFESREGAAVLAMPAGDRSAVCAPCAP